MSKICPKCQKTFDGNCIMSPNYCECQVEILDTNGIDPALDTLNIKVINNLIQHSEHVLTLYNAIKMINLRNCAIEFNGALQFINERSFAYELYRTWNMTKPSHLIVNAEVTKTIKNNKKDYFRMKAKEIFGKEVYRFYPDIVLHSSQADSCNQEIICEIKTLQNINSNPDAIEKDIKKLNAYTAKGVVMHHEFRTGVFILVNGTLLNLADKLSDESIKLFLDSKILFISLQISGWDIVPEIKTPSELIELRNNLKK